MKPSPGEWTATEQAVHATIKGNPTYKLIAIVYGDDKRGGEDARSAANSKILAASKRLLTTLKALTACYRTDTQGKCTAAEDAEALIKELES